MTTGNRVVRLQARPQVTSPPPVRYDATADVVARCKATVASAHVILDAARAVLAMRQERLALAGAVQHQDARVEGMRRNRERQRMASMGWSEADIAAAERADSLEDPAARMVAHRELQRARAMSR